MPLGELKIGFLGHPGVKFQDTELGVVPNFMFLAYTHVLGVRNQIPFDEFKVEFLTDMGWSQGQGVGARAQGLNPGPGG